MLVTFLLYIAIGMFVSPPFLFRELHNPDNYTPDKDIGWWILCAIFMVLLWPILIFEFSLRVLIFIIKKIIDDTK